MRVIDDPARLARERGLYGMGQQMRGQLAGGPSTVGKAPQDPVVLAPAVQPDQAEGILRLHGRVAEIPSRPRDREGGAGQLRNGKAQRYPRAGAQFFLSGAELLFGEAKAQISPVALMPAHTPAVVGQPHKAAEKPGIRYFHARSP